MKIKYETETDGCTYTEKLFIDDKLVNETVHENTVGGSKRISGKDWEDVVEEDLADKLETFFAFDLFCYANERIEE